MKMMKALFVSTLLVLTMLTTVQPISAASYCSHSWQPMLSCYNERLVATYGHSDNYNGTCFYNFYIADNIKECRSCGATSSEYGHDHKTIGHTSACSYSNWHCWMMN